MGPIAQLHVGGLVAAGLDTTGRYFLIVSHSGTGVFDTTTWQRVARDTALVYPVDGLAIGIGPITGQMIPVKEIDFNNSMMTDETIGPYLVSYGEGDVFIRSAET